MSIDATRWAWMQVVGRASAKIVLLSLADRADERNECYPSINRLTYDTELDRKTVMECISYLSSIGLLSVKKSNAGNTYTLIGVENRHDSSPKIGTSPKNGTTSSPEIGTTEGASSPKNGTRVVPKTGHKPINNHKEQKQELPDWIPVDAWEGFLEMRTSIKKPMTGRALTIAINKLADMKSRGINIEDVLNQSTMNNWQGIFEPKTNNRTYRRGEVAL